MGKVKAILHIDEDKLRQMAEENGYDYSLLEAIKNELGWVEQSGISVVDVEEIVEETKIHIYGKDVHEWLLDLERITTDGMEQIIEFCFQLQTKHPDKEILVQESDDQLGIIIDIYEGDENIFTETFWYEDINE